MDVLAALSLVGNIFQFVDFTTKIISKSAQLYRCSDGALAENIDIETTTKDLVLLNEKLKDAAADIADTPLQSLCKSCNSVADELLATLAKLKLQSKQHKWESIQKALQSVWSKEKIRGLEGRLARFRDELNLHIMIELRKQVSQLNLEQLGRFINQDAMTQKILDAVIKQQKILHRAELQSHEQKTSLVKQIRFQTDEMSAGLFQQLRLLEASIASLQTSQMRLEQSLSTQTREIRERENTGLAEADIAPRIHTESPLPTSGLESTDMNRESQGAGPCVEIDTRVCDCSVRYSRHVRLFSGLIRVRLSSKHMPTCIYSKKSKYLEISATCQLPLLWKILNMSFTANRDAGTYSLAPTISITRIVDRRVNPAFLLFQNIQKSCSEMITTFEWTSYPAKKMYVEYQDGGRSVQCQLQWDSIALDGALREALRQINILFATGQSSALDTDVNGNTLLHEIVGLANMVEETSETTKWLFRALISYMISAGAAKDAETREHPRTLASHFEGTHDMWILKPAYNLELRHFHWSPPRPRGSPRDIAIWDSKLRSRISRGLFGLDVDQLLEELDLNPSDNLPRLLEDLDSLGFSDFVRTRPYIASDMGYGELALAVIRRDISKLNNLLTQKFDPDDTWCWSHASGWQNEIEAEEPRRFPPLALALGWPDGMESLLNAGSNPLLAFMGLSHLPSGSKKSVLILLGYNIPLSIPILDSGLNGRFGLRTAASIILQGYVDDYTKMAMFETLVSQRAELKRLALQILSSSEKMSFGLKDEDGVLPDAHAAEISMALTNKGVQLLPAVTVSYGDYFQMNSKVHAGHHTPIYHRSYPGMSPKIAEFLFTSGFKDIDTVAFSTTPLWESCYMSEFEMGSWLVDKGACPVLTIGGIQVNALSALGHLFRGEIMGSLSLFFNRDDDDASLMWKKKKLKNLDDSRLVPRLLESIKAKAEDCCPCFCSEDDPAHISGWMRSVGPDKCLDFPTKLDLMTKWVGLLHAPAGILWKCWQAFFRAEIFERLGLAHTCHYWRGRIVYDVSDESERSELRDEDVKAGLVADLESWMEKFNTLEMNFIQSGGSLSSFVAAWILELNQELFENETIKGISVKKNVHFNPASYILGLKSLQLHHFLGQKRNFV